MEKLLSEVLQVLPICKRCHNEVGTWSDVPPFCLLCNTAAEKAEYWAKSESEPERLKHLDFVRNLVNCMHTAIMMSDGLPYDIKLRFKP